MNLDFDDDDDDIDPVEEKAWDLMEPFSRVFEPDGTVTLTLRGKPVRFFQNRALCGEATDYAFYTAARNGTEVLKELDAFMARRMN
jgi:hypothetical protein